MMKTLAREIQTDFSNRSLNIGIGQYDVGPYGFSLSGVKVFSLPKNKPIAAK